MKSKYLLAIMFICCVNVSFAQIRVNSAENVGIGTYPTSHKVTTDGNFLMRFSNSMWGGGMSITQWTGSWFMDEFIDLSPVIGLHPKIQHSLGKRSPFYGIYAWNGEFDHLTTSIFYNLSDEKLKRNVNSLSFDRKSFANLQPASYEISTAAVLKTKSTKEKSEAPVYTPQYGFIAQELQKIYPQLVLKDEETGYLKTKPLEMIPIMVAALQDQQKQIDELKQLASTKSILKSSEEIDNVMNISSETITGKAVLYQNIPNPFNESAEIRYYIPENSKLAQLCIYDLQGKPVKQIVIDERGEGSHQLPSSELTAGMYLYTLIIDSKKVDTKRMILTD